MERPPVLCLHHSLVRRGESGGRPCSPAHYCIHPASLPLRVQLYLQLSVFQGNMFGDPTYVYPDLPPPFDTTINVSGATCLPNVAYAPGLPPCSSPVLFNASCVLPDADATVCWADVNYGAPAAGCGSAAAEAYCVANALWAPAPRNASLTLPLPGGGNRTCFRRGAYSAGDPCGAAGLWPNITIPATTCDYADAIAAGGVLDPQPPCNDPTLPWFPSPNDAFFNVSDASPAIVSTTTLGQLASLRVRR